MKFERIKLEMIVFLFSPVQVIYAVAYEGTRLEIPEGPLGKLISGLPIQQNFYITLYIVLVLYDMLFIMLMVADCWAEPDERPSCEEIFSRLLDCEYNLC